MNKYLPAIISIMFVSIGLLSLLGLVNNISSESIKQEVAGMSAFNLANNPNILKAVIDSTPSLLVPANAHSRIAALAMQAAAKVKTFNEQRVFYCTALIEYEKAISSNPRNSRYIIAWSNVKQILQDVTCEGSLGLQEYKHAVEEAVRINPYDMDVLYSAGLISLWAKEKETALVYFNRMLNIGLSMPRERWEVVARQIEKPGDVSKLIPPRFPQIGDWSRFLLNQSDVLMTPDLMEELGVLQKQALKDVQIEIEKNGTPPEIYRKYLFSLLDAAADDQIRREIDERLIHIAATREVDRANFLKARANTQGLEIVRASLDHDLRAQKGVFLKWGSEDAVYFDSFHTSLGFYLADQQSVSLIELRSKKQPKRDISKLIEVYVSRDNEKWVKISSRIGEPIKIFDYWSLPIELDGQDYQFFKVHFNSSARNNSFVDRLDRGLFAYGKSARVGSY